MVVEALNLCFLHIDSSNFFICYIESSGKNLFYIEKSWNYLAETEFGTWNFIEKGLYPRQVQKICHIVEWE